MIKLPYLCEGNKLQETSYSKKNRWTNDQQSSKHPHNSGDGSHEDQIQQYREDNRRIDEYGHCGRPLFRDSISQARLEE
jgi:hypothetical protein